MRRILILMGRYLPGHRDGGPLRTIVNLTEALGDEYEFYIACLDRDHGDTAPYSNIVYDTWNQVGKAKVWYVRPGKFTFQLIKSLSENIDVIYSCGFFNDYGYKTLLLNRFGKLNGKPVVVASMGTFSCAALAQKKLKKRVFISGCKLLGCFKNIKWSVTSELEMKDVKRIIGTSADCVIAEDLPRVKVPGISANKNYATVLKVVFLSRICLQKNLVGAIRTLQQIKEEIVFDIYGPKEDFAYWTVCEQALTNLPNNITWEYKEDVPSDCVQETLQKYDALLLPTKGENYGHVIFEALSVGCIPIISDQTPWSFIADCDAGYVISLTDNMCSGVMALNELISLSAEQKLLKAENAVAVAKTKVLNAKEKTGYRKIFAK